MSNILQLNEFGYINYEKSNICSKSEKRSKLVKKSESVVNEIIIGELLDNMENNIDKNRYLYVIEHSDTNVRDLQSMQIDKCNVIADLSLIELTYSPMYTNDMFDYMVTFADILPALNIHTNKKLSLIFETYMILLKSIDLMIENNIVHLNLNNDNVIFDNNFFAKIQDFSFSLNTQKFKPDNFVYNVQLDTWPLEVHLISYLITRNIDMLQRENTEEVINNFIFTNKDNCNFYNFNNFDLCKKVIEKYIGKTTKYIIKDVLLFHDTWDNYALSILYLKIINSSFSQNYNIIIEKFNKLLLKNISIDKEKRLDIQDTRNAYKNILFNSDFDYAEFFQ